MQTKETTVKEITKKAFELLQNSNGFSLNKEGKEPKNGYMVSVPIRGVSDVLSKNITEEVLQQWIQNNIKILKNEKWYLGGWIEKDLLYLNLSINITSKRKAVILGKLFNQIAIFDLQGFTSINIGGTGKSVFDLQHCIDIIKAVGV